VADEAGRFDDARQEPSDKNARTMTKAEAAELLRRTGYSSRDIHDVLAGLSDPIDIDQMDPALVERYGLTSEQLMDRLGGGP